MPRIKKTRSRRQISELQPLFAGTIIRTRKRSTLLSAARIKKVVSTYGLPVTNAAPPFVLSAKQTFDFQTGAFLSASRLRSFNAGYPFIEFPHSPSTDQYEAGLLTLVVPNRPNTGFAIQVRVYNDVFPISPGKYRVDVYQDNYSSPTQLYEVVMQPMHQTLGFYLTPRANQLTWPSINLYPVWNTSGAWTVYDVTINMVT